MKRNIRRPRKIITERDALTLGNRDNSVRAISVEHMGRS